MSPQGDSESLEVLLIEVGVWFLEFMARPPCAPLEMGRFAERSSSQVKRSVLLWDSVSREKGTGRVEKFPSPSVSAFAWLGDELREDLLDLLPDDLSDL